MSNEDLNEYVVVADAVTVSTGRLAPNREPEVVRLVHGETIKAPEGNPSVAELLAMGGIVNVETLKDEMVALNKKGGQYRPTVVRDKTATPLREFRITAAGVSAMMLNGEEVEMQEDVVPTHAPTPDLSVPGEAALSV